MKVVIGLWLIMLGIVILFVSLENMWTFKEKIKMVFEIMLILTLLFSGVCLMVGK